jgi:nucleoside-diphosphate-sugar epimerase
LIDLAGRAYLVTGGSGLIGGYVVKALVERGDRVVVFDIKPPMNPKMKWVLEPVWDKVVFVEGSVSDDLPSLLKACKDNDVERVFHAAALFRGQYEQEHPYYSFHVTVNGMLNICETARLLGLGRIVFAGTNVEYIHLFKDTNPTSLVETEAMFDPAMGTSPYGASKMAASIVGMCYWQTQNVDWVSTRYTRVWGFGAKAETSRMESIVENAVDGLPTIIEREGDQKRNHCYIKDLTEGILRALDVDNARLEQRVFNLGGPDELSDIELAGIVKGYLPSAHIEVKSGGVDRRAIDSAAAVKQLGWKPEWDMRRSVKDYIGTYLLFKKSKYPAKS